MQTIGDYLDYWLEKVVRGNVRQSTYMAYRGYVVNHLQECVGNIMLNEIRAKHMKEAVSALQNKGLATKTVRSIMLMLRSALKCAVEYEYITKNPCEKVRLPQLDEKDITIFNAKKQHKLEKTIAKSNDVRNYGVLISLYTGIRIGELCGLKWENIDFTQKIMEIKNSLNRVITYDSGSQKTILAELPPKTKKSRRTIPLPSFLCELLKAMKKLSNSEYVISMKSGKAVEPRVMQGIYSRLLKKAEVPYVNFHTLRHTFATRAIESGADVKTVSEILGHTNTMITLNLYTHSLFEQKRKLMDKLNTLHKNHSDYFTKKNHRVVCSMKKRALLKLMPMQIAIF